ncbi:MAG: pyrroloquinoline quinone biosynthesis peptide chaperone PqqD [Alphaproteobacteria bacterium]|nr:pyrroloquinoline quinone biosynthesis peptide chaperone PqqD [Alphaproteobacteria bacterium]
MERTLLIEASVPAFPRGVKFRFNQAKQQWVILAPERLLVPDETAVEVLKLCDGAVSIATVVDLLAAKFSAPRDVIATDVIAMLQDLADKAFLIDAATAAPAAAGGRA